ncbi:MAG: metallophosphoesterase, partial [Clostridiales bacterium]|nr:metallophosphoesterase [Clostridiales bacterium]
VPEATVYLIIGLIPIFAALFGSLFALFLLPSLKSKGRKVVAGILFLAVVFTCSAYGFKLVPFEFTITDPFVLDIGTGYSVVWGTNAESIGWITYTKSGETEEQIVWCHDEGNKRLGVIHNALIPYDEFTDAEYKVHAQRSHGTVTFGNHLGKTVDSAKTYRFTDDRTIDNKAINIASFSDWHDHGYLAKGAFDEIEKATGKIDLLIMGGDYSDYFVSESMVVTNVIKAAASVTGGTIPVIFIKGNHEARNDGLDKVWSKLGLEKSYSQVDRNGILFTILDIGEDNNGGDANYEYGGMNIFAQYDQEQLDWYESLKGHETDRYNILLAHGTLGSLTGYYQDAYAAQAKAMNTKIVVGGHTHASRLTEYPTAEHPDYPVCYNFEDGARTDLSNRIVPLDLIRKLMDKNSKFDFGSIKNLFVESNYVFYGGSFILSGDRSTISFRVTRNNGDLQMPITDVLSK